MKGRRRFSCGSVVFKNIFMLVSVVFRCLVLSSKLWLLQKFFSGWDDRGVIVSKNMFSSFLHDTTAVLLSAVLLTDP